MQTNPEAYDDWKSESNTGFIAFIALVTAAIITLAVATYVLATYDLGMSQDTRIGLIVTFVVILGAIAISTSVYYIGWRRFIIGSLSLVLVILIAGMFGLYHIG